jgi:ankyrin repeat protein
MLRAAKICFLVVIIVCTAENSDNIRSQNNLNVDYAEVPNNIEGIDITDERGHSPLMLAAMSGHLEPVKNYIKGGAQVNLQNNDGYSALMLSAKNGFYYTSLELIRSDLS